MHYIPPPTWPRIAREARAMRKLAESLSNAEERRKAEVEAEVLMRRAKKQKALDDSRR
jgi:hypothetical protein